MCEPLISVIVPTAGRAEFLRQALRSVQQQTWQRWECLVINDDPAHQMASGSVVEDFSDRRFTFLANERPLGPGESRNTGIRVAQGNIIAFLDDDDRWAPDYLQRVAETQQHFGQPALVYSDCIMEWRRDPSGEALLEKTIPSPNTPSNPRRAVWIEGFCPMTLSSIAVSKECLDDVGLFDPTLRIGEDVDLYLRIADRFPFLRAANAYAIYNIHSGPRLTSDFQRQAADMRCITERYDLGPQYIHSIEISVKQRAAASVLLAATSGRWRDRLCALRAFFRIKKPGTPLRLLVHVLVIGLFPFRVYKLARAFRRQ